MREPRTGDVYQCGSEMAFFVWQNTGDSHWWFIHLTHLEKRSASTIGDLAAHIEDGRYVYLFNFLDVLKNNANIG